MKCNISLLLRLLSPPLFLGGERLFLPHPFLLIWQTVKPKKRKKGGLILPKGEKIGMLFQLCPICEESVFVL